MTTPSADALRRAREIVNRLGLFTMTKGEAETIVVAREIDDAVREAEGRAAVERQMYVNLLGDIREALGHPRALTVVDVSNECSTLRAHRDKLLALVRDVAASGCTDLAMRYVEVQIDRATWEDVRKEAKE